MGWIKVGDKKPNPHTKVLVYTNVGRVDIRSFNTNAFKSQTDIVTHWQPLPDAPNTLPTSQEPLFQSIEQTIKVTLDKPIDSDNPLVRYEIANLTPLEAIAMLTSVQFIEQKKISISSSVKG